MTAYAHKKCICNSERPHFCPPCFGEAGFYACDIEDIISNVEELKAENRYLSGVLRRLYTKLKQGLEAIGEEV